MIGPDEVVVDLAAAQEQAPDLGGGPCVSLEARVVDHRAECPGGEVGWARGGLRQAEQGLGRHHHHRAGVGVERLASQQVEVLRRRRRVQDADVALRPEGQEPLQARRRVLRPGSLVAVRQQQRQAGRLPPLRQPGDDELVDDDLGAVHEVAVLRLPQHERLRRRDRVAVLEAEGRVLAERRVVDLEGGCGLRQVLERHVALAVGGVPQRRMALAERPADGVLPREADGRPAGQQRGEREQLGVAPIDPRLILVVEGGRATLELLEQLRMDGEAVRAPRSSRR